MNRNIFRKLKKWRITAAKREMVEVFRVLQNRTLEEIAELRPKTREDLIKIKGIKERKFEKYGKDILDIIKSESEDCLNGSKPKNDVLPLDIAYQSLKVNEQSGENGFSDRSRRQSSIDKKEKVYSVSKFLDFLNNSLTIHNVRIKGEISSVDEREKVVYFTLKDKNDESLLNCLIFRYQYEISGVKLKTGEEIIVEGNPNIYKPTGKLSFKTNSIEVVGEGALKRAYEELKRKLEKEGLFLQQRKKTLPRFPRTIGLITSNQGAAMGDFITNVGNYGFNIKFINSSVEGKRAVFDLIKAVEQFEKMRGVDVLVIIRGGGSLESLQAFNNESLVRKISSLKVPVVCGVGHEKDTPLVSLVSDVAVSTPTAAARTIRESWEKAVQKLNHDQRTVVNSFEKCLSDSKYRIERITRAIDEGFKSVFYRFSKSERDLIKNLERIYFSLKSAKKDVLLSRKCILSGCERMILSARNKVKAIKNTIENNDPEGRLKLGYSIAFINGKIVKNVRQISKNDLVNIKVSDGEFISEVRSVDKEL